MPKPYEQCQFIKQNGVQCKNKAIFCGYCGRHLGENDGNSTGFSEKEGVFSENDVDLFDDDALL